MLLELTIRQFAIIKELKVSFQQGLNILTGETGAGKSIIIDAIQLITGGRGSIDFIRNQEDKAEIEALFDLPLNHQVFAALPELGINSSEEGMLFLKRELLRNGKSICRINGQLVTLAVLKEVGQWLIQLHSQHQHQQLLTSEKQLDLLDAYGELKITELKKDFFNLYNKYSLLKKEAKTITENEKELAQRVDLLKYQINEIASAKLQSNEDEELLQKRNKIRYSEKITTNLKNSYENLANDYGINDLLSQTVGLLEQINSYDPELNKLYEQLASAFYQIEDVTAQLSIQVQDVEYDPKILNNIEERLSLIHHLKRKYGESVNAIIEYAATIETELEQIDNREVQLQQIQKELKQITKEIAEKALVLSDMRQEYAGELSTAIVNQLRDLQMKNIQFSVALEREESANGLEIEGRYFHLSVNGLDKISFLISPNPGEPLKPLQKIASGGELSRIMLAIQTILADKDQIPTIIFDEIDTGVSGQAAQAIAEKLAHVAKQSQVFVVTHLPQVAAMADHHYVIQKNIENSSTYTEISYLSEERRIAELARMLGGVEVTELTRSHAQEMIEKSHSLKQQK